MDDGVSISLRWGLLLALGLLLASSGASTTSPIILLALGGLWNALLTILWLRGTQWGAQKKASLLADLGLSFALFFFSGTLLGPLVWAGLLPVLSAAWGFGLGAGLLSALAMSIGFALMAAIDLPLAQIPLRMAGPTLAFLWGGVVTGFIKQQWQLVIQEGGELEQTRQADLERRERRRVKALYAVTATLNSTLNMEQVMDLALDLGIGALEEPEQASPRAVGGILLFHEGGLRLAAARRLAARDLSQVLPGQQGALAELLRHGEARVIFQPSKDAELSSISSLQNCQSLYCMPLRFGLDLFGVMFFGHSQEEFFDEERRDLVDVVARQVIVALQNAQLYEAVNEEKERILEIQDQVLTQLARNLHNGPIQSVAAIAMRVNLARRLLSKDAAAAGEELYKLEDLARRTTKEIRHMLFTLKPQALETSGLAAALKDLASQIQEGYEQQVGIEADPAAAQGMDLSRQGVLFYIAVEALNNARMHAQAKNIQVKLSRPEREIVLLEVQDDGVGFDVAEAETRGKEEDHLGLRMMRQRAELINGVMRLDSQKGDGTKLRVWAPLSEEAGERLRQGK